MDGVRVEVTQLKRSGETVDLRFTIINDSDRSLNAVDLDAFAFPTIGGVYLIDPVGKKKYFVVRDGEGGCVCNGVEAVDRRSRVNLWARFPAPPDEVKRISIVIPRIAPMDDVPLSR